MSPDIVAFFIGNQFMQLAFAGAMGGLVRWGYKRESWKFGIPHIVVGSITAAFVGRAAEPLFRPLVDFSQVDPIAAMMLSGYFIGVTGVTLPALVIDFTEKRARLLTASANDTFTGEVSAADAAPSQPTEEN